MPLNTSKLEQDLKAAADKASLNNGLSAQQRRDTYNADIAAAHDAFVKSASIYVTTTGTATAHTGTGTIS